MTIPDSEELDAFSFWGYMKDAVIYNNIQTDKGNEWLDNAWILQQTKPEREKLRQKYGNQGGGK